MDIQKKMDRLAGSLRSLPGAIVAYSGGADSALLAEFAHEALGPKSLAVTADSPSLPRRELSTAAKLAAKRGWRHKVIRTAELEDERYASNPLDRCYFCKTALFDELVPLAMELGVPILLGTNTDDLTDWRPGARAASERGTLSPLVEAGFSKSDVREASERLQLPTAFKPAAACLSSRFAYGVRVTREGLARVEAAEDFLLSEGFRVVRVRDLGADRARVEVGADEVGRISSMSDGVTAFLRAVGFAEILIDKNGYRRGALNSSVPVTIGKT